MGFLLALLLAISPSWEKTEFLWNFGIISSSDKGISSNPSKFFAEELTFDKTLYQNIQKGDIVWLKCLFVPRFCKEVLPEIEHPFILVIADGDESFPSECGSVSCLEVLLTSDKVLHIFAQNCDYKGPSKKITPLPIGVDFHTVAYKDMKGTWGETGTPLEQEKHLKEILKTLKPTSLRKKRAFVDFQHSDTTRGPLGRFRQFGEDRKTIFERLKKTKLIDYSDRMKRSKLWKKKGEYAFSISPYGNGLDCHRTWEDLLLGCIVIVRTSPLDPLYENLPVVIVNDWSEVTEENLEKWLKKFGDAFTNPEYRKRLTNVYWWSKIKEMVGKNGAADSRM